MTSFKTHLPVGLVLGSLLFAPAIEAKTMYRLKTLGAVSNPLSPDFLYGSTGTAINDEGVVAGTINYVSPATNNPVRAFISNQDDTMTDLGALLGNSWSFGQGINASGQIAGYSPSPAKDRVAHAFLTNVNGNLLDLGTLGGQSRASDVNDKGQVTGSAEVINTGFDHAFLTTADGPMTDLGTLGDDNSTGIAINNSGQVTGKSFTVGSQIHAFITDANGLNMRELISATNASIGYAINSNGQVAGQLNQHAFVTGPDGENPHNLLGLNDTKSSATGINDAGNVIGNYTHTSLGDRAFIADANGNAKDLGKLLIVEDPTLCTSLTANDINNSGKITGRCSNNSTIAAAMILTPEEIQSVPADKANSIKISESQQDTLNCDVTKKCSVGTAASGSYSLTLKLSANTLSSHDIDLSQLKTNTRFAFSTASYAFSGTLASADPNKKHQTPTSLPATWTAQHSECKKYAADTSCSQPKNVVDGSVKISADKKHNLTITLKGKKTTVNGENFGQQLLAGLCPTATAGNSQVIDSALFSIGTAPLPMTVKLDCKLQQRAKTISASKESFKLNTISTKAQLTNEP
jgi:probable HAF family extracellular repeat protein